MGRVVLKYVVIQRVKGREYHYFRHGGLYRRLPAPADPTFSAIYHKLLAKVRCDIGSEIAEPGTFGELVEKYLASGDYGRLATSTKGEYRRHLDRLKELWGPLRARRLTRGAVFEYRDTLQATPRKASYAMQVLRRLLSFGVDRGLLDTNVALRPGNMASQDEHKPWSDADIKTFRDTNAGNDIALIILMLALCTGQRRGDLVKMTRADYNGREIAVVQNKTNEKVWIPAHASLRAELEAIKRFMLLETERGKAFKARHLSAVFLDAIRRANLNGLTLHGLRVTAATWMADAGCSDAELQTILGHRTVAMASKYRRLAQKKIMAASAIENLERLRPKV